MGGLMGRARGYGQQDKMDGNAPQEKFQGSLGNFWQGLEFCRSVRAYRATINTAPHFPLDFVQSTVTCNKHPRVQVYAIERPSSSWTTKELINSTIPISHSEQPETNRHKKMGREEQIEEREVLDSIFPDEITGSHLTSK